MERYAMTEAVENDGAATLRSKLRTLRHSFLDALISICERKGVDDKPLAPSAAELTVIRGVLRDNGMVLKGTEEDDELKEALEGAKADLPETFGDEDDE
jgi:hypothetical protein